MSSPQRKMVLIIGAGPAGLACAYELEKRGGNKFEINVIEADKQVGGLSKTVNFSGYYYDLGGHRFFSKIDEANELWREVLPRDLLIKKRLSRILFQDKLFHYPLNITDVIRNLGPIEIIRIFLSCFRAKLFSTKNEKSFQDWITNRFGYRLFRTFFKTYTEKLWGMPCDSISADWAAQRIRNLSLRAVFINAIFGRMINKRPKTLIVKFQYPKYGPGMMYETLARRLGEKENIRINLKSRVEALRFINNKWVVTVKTDDGHRECRYDHIVSTMPVTELISILSFGVPRKVKEAAQKLRYRSFMVVCLVFDRPNNLPDNWLYIHEPKVSMGRLQIVNNWSQDMVKDKNNFSCACEYFCSQNDELWRRSDKELVDLAVGELRFLHLTDRGSCCRQGNVVRVAKAYPVYDEFYKKGMGIIQNFLKTAPSLQVAGRNGMFKYNNMDHSIYTGMLAARNIMAGNKKYDLWQINQDEEYQEHRP